MEKNFKIIIEYNGRDFHGWQIQPDCITIQGEIEKALSIMTNSHVDLHGSGRTDAGVHALAQAANFSLTTKIPPESFKKGLNSLLPSGIVILECREVPLSFHARFSAKLKTYEYKILNRHLRSALLRGFVWQVQQRLDIDKMKQAALFFAGEHDFKSFEAAGSPRSHTVRIIKDCRINLYDNENIGIEVTANGFLRYMVRNIAGTLVQVGLGKFEPEDIKHIIEKKNRACAGITAPSYGLFLKKVIY